jgi:oxygen-independent coproporphyrinogen-3 oxidase
MVCFCPECKNSGRIPKMVEEGKIPVVKGHVLNEEDLIVRRHILNLMCQLETTFNENNSFLNLKMHWKC